MPDQAGRTLGELLKPDQAAEELNTSVRHIRSLIYGGKLSYIKVGHLVRIERSELLDFIDRQRVAATVQP